MIRPQYAKQVSCFSSNELICFTRIGVLKQIQQEHIILHDDFQRNFHYKNKHTKATPVHVMFHYHLYVLF